MTIMMAAGVDVGRDWLDVAIAPSGKHFRTPNTPAGIASIPGRLSRAGVTRVVLELIGALAARLVRALTAAGLEVGVVDPRRIAMRASGDMWVVGDLLSVAQPPS